MNDLVITEKPLTRREQVKLQKLEEVIQRGFDSFYEIGQALDEIRDSRLYRQDHPTFELYCRSRWGMSKTNANRHILAFKTTKLLAPIGAIPAKESQVRPLTKLDPEQQVEAWRTVMDRAGEASNVTASLVNDVVDTMIEKGHARVLQPKPVARYVNHTRMMKDLKNAIDTHGWDVDQAAIRWLSRYK